MFSYFWDKFKEKLRSDRSRWAGILVMGFVVLAAGCAARQFGVSLDGASLKEEAASKQEEIFMAELTGLADMIRDPGLSSYDWKVLDRNKYGFEVRFPSGWEERIVEGSDEEGVRALVTREVVTFQPRGKRYFREPDRLYPLTLEVYDGSQEKFELLYPPDVYLASEKVVTGDFVAYGNAQESQEILFIIKHPRRKNMRIVLRDSVNLLKGISDVERQELRDNVVAIVASLRFSN